MSSDVNGSVIGVYANDFWREEPIFFTIANISLRQNCLLPFNHTPTQPYHYCFPQLVDYGVAVLGNLDPLNQTVPAQLIVLNRSEPDWGKEDKINAQPVMFESKLLVSQLLTNFSYSCVRYVHHATFSFILFFGALATSI